MLVLKKFNHWFGIFCGTHGLTGSSRSWKVNFDTILPVWQQQLWLGRRSEIKPMSSILFLGGYNNRFL